MCWVADPLNRDKNTGALVTIDYAHHEIHDGDMFKTTYNADKSMGDNLDILIVTPNTRVYPHIAWEIGNESEAQMYVYEGTTTSSNGTAVTVTNKDRNSLKTSGVLAFHTPTFGSVGTEIFNWHSGSGKGGGSGNREETEAILKQNTKYLYRVNAVAAGWVAVRLTWYDHKNRT